MSFIYGRNRNGFIITLDILIASTLVLLILFVAFNYLSLSKISKLPEISSLRLANDIVAVLDYENVLDSFDKDYIESKVNSLLPVNLKMSMKINRYNQDSKLIDQIQINEDIKEDFLEGKWAFVTFQSSDAVFNLAQYKIGFK